ncbi:hypothetical protein ABBQ38_005411 [Trebouxia sp. C0009 RCD-2024]
MEIDEHVAACIVHHENSTDHTNTTKASLSELFYSCCARMSVICPVRPAETRRRKRDDANACCATENTIPTLKKSITSQRGNSKFLENLAIRVVSANNMIQPKSKED